MVVMPETMIEKAIAKTHWYAFIVGPILESLFSDSCRVCTQGEKQYLANCREIAPKALQLRVILGKKASKNFLFLTKAYPPRQLNYMACNTFFTSGYHMKLAAISQ